MAQQTYPVDHAVYINAKPDQAFTDYTSLLADIQARDNQKIMLKFGPSLRPHLNHVEALNLAHLEDYDLFLKVDDDDVYRSGYVESVVKSYKEHHWDFSGSFTQGLINKEQWHPNQRYNSLGLSPKDEALGVIEMMPPTFAFSKNAIDAIISFDLQAVEDPDQFEDILWRQFLTADSRFKIHFRDQSEYVYQLHGQNYCLSQEVKA